MEHFLLSNEIPCNGSCDKTHVPKLGMTSFKLTSSFFFASRFDFFFRVKKTAKHYLCIIYACLRKPGVVMEIQDGNCSREDVRSELKIENKSELNTGKLLRFC